MKSPVIICLCTLLLMFSAAKANDAEQKIDSLDPYIEKLTFGPLKIGGSFALEYRRVDYGEVDDKTGNFYFSNAKIALSFNKEAYIAQAKYAFYFYENLDRWVNWLQYAWVGYKFSSNQQVRIGINKVPFGLLPYSSVSWYENLSYYVGLEDDYDLGIKYMGQFGQWDLQLGYYLTDEGSYIGGSSDSARYSFDLVKDEGATNQEKNQFNLRLAYNAIYSQLVFRKQVHRL